ncbi:ABC transporter substrate-binding protein [Gimesia sp.]|uniref:ABC transporter substrate-binding protein n=1 Tax=Gimesia sp. TaxID=2024833 RepID=UPI003A94ED36
MKLSVPLLSLLFLMSAGCQQEKQTITETADKNSTITVTDLAGREVTLQQPIERIILMRSLGLYELAAVLGDEVEEKLVGWDSSLKTGDLDTWQKYIERFPRLDQVTILGDILRDTVSAEAVLALKPDLVIMNTYMLNRGSKTVERLEQAGVPLLFLRSEDPFRDPQESIRLLGQVLGKTERANAAADWIDAELQPVLSQLKTIEGKVPTIYLEAGTQGPEKYGNTFGENQQGKTVNWGSVLAQLRCQNIAAGAISGLYGMGVIRPEFLLTADPEVIVITGAHWTAFPDSLQLGYATDRSQATQQLAAFTTRPGWSDLAAVKNQRVHGIHTRFGSHLMSFAAAQQLAKWLYPEKFQDLNPEERLREFHQKFLPVEMSGTWMVSLDGE